MKVFVVSYDAYGDTYPVFVFPTEEAAESYKKEVGGKDLNPYKVDEVEFIG